MKVWVDWILILSGSLFLLVSLAVSCIFGEGNGFKDVVRLI